MTLAEAQPEIIWPRLDRYKDAVVGNVVELDQLRETLLAEIEHEVGVSGEIKSYTINQFEQIEARYMPPSDPRRVGRGPGRN